MERQAEVLFGWKATQSWNSRGAMPWSLVLHLLGTPATFSMTAGSALHKAHIPLGALTVAGRICWPAKSLFCTHHEVRGAQRSRASRPRGRTREPGCRSGRAKRLALSARQFGVDSGVVSAEAEYDQALNHGESGGAGNQRLGGHAQIQRTLRTRRWLHHGSTGKTSSEGLDDTASRVLELATPWEGSTCSIIADTSTRFAGSSSWSQEDGRDSKRRSVQLRPDRDHSF